MEKTSRFNYIKRGLVGVCAATMLTGLCAGTAFAAGDFTGETAEPGTSTQYSDGGTATTEVGVQALTGAQVYATVPTSVTAAVAADGTLTFPNTNFKVVLGQASDDSWRAKVTSLNVAVSGANKLATDEASLSSTNNLFITLNSTTLKDGVITDASLLDAFVQATGGTAQDVTLSMAGKMFNPTYQQVKDGIAAATLTWTISLI